MYSDTLSAGGEVMSSVNYQLKHLSIRVPWHDNGWNGCICNNPKENTSCLRLKRISTKKNEDLEEYAGKSFDELEEKHYPPCVLERVNFMSPKSFEKTITHPYYKTSPETHGHFLPTNLRFPPYSSPALPFRWMLRDTDIHRQFQLHYDEDKEPELKFSTSWIQQKDNQSERLTCFFDHVKINKSLCFFYAKQIPFVEDSRRVLIGVGRVKNISDIVEYKSNNTSKLRSVLWERMVHHSIRPDFEDGFILPYREMDNYFKDNPDSDPSQFVAFAPEEKWLEFSYATEHVSNDGAIDSLLSLKSALENIKKQFPGNWDYCIKWIHDRLSEIWKLRGAFPGLGTALTAFGIRLGIFVAFEILEKIKENEDPWPLIEEMFSEPTKYLSPRLAKQIDGILCKTWKNLPSKRKQLLHLISRFDLSVEQAKLIYIGEERKKYDITYTDEELIANPYLIYESTRFLNDEDNEDLEPVSVLTIDKGIFPETMTQEKHPIPEPSALHSGVDERRIRALIIKILEESSENGDTLVPEPDLIIRIRNFKIHPSCDINSDILNSIGEFSGEIKKVEMADGSTAYQLQRLFENDTLIRNVIEKRLKADKLTIEADWRDLLDIKLDNKLQMNNNQSIEEQEENQARSEKTSILKELAKSRFSVLVGPAGTGKTTLLSVLCSHPDILKNGVLLLAPTGKARVKIEQATKELNLRAYTLAQFLTKNGRYKNGRYVLLGKRGDQNLQKTVIVDEASMLTEEMLGSLFESLKNVERLILVGDPSQLPPIGPGRPFVDIIQYITKKREIKIFPKVIQGYGELTIKRRQQSKIEDGKKFYRDDLLLAEWFSGRELDPGADEVFNIINNHSPFIKCIEWNNNEDLEEKMVQCIVDELSLQDADDIDGFDESLGGKIGNNVNFFNVGAGYSAEFWQILSPVRNKIHGVQGLNRLIHNQFRNHTLDYARKERYRKIPKPAGVEEIVYGDKVINVRNHRRSGSYKVYPLENALEYIANGEIGIVIGQFRSKNMKHPPDIVKVEFSSQPGFMYSFFGKEFKEENDFTLELAYALTVHKSQGSEFDIVFFVVPKNCRLLTRELLYTALTRQKNRIIILHQESLHELKKYASKSEIATRITNLFEPPKIIEIKKEFFIEHLIHHTANGELVRSKSEVIIADHLYTKGIEYSYEKPLEINGVIKYPDFTMVDEDIGKTYYWEHCGLLFDPIYKERWEKKLRWYEQNNIRSIEDGGNLIITKDDEKGGIDSENIEQIINEIFC